MVNPMLRVGGVLACAAVGLLMAGSAHAITFSVDGPSAGLNGVFPDDLLFPGPGPVLPGAGGLPPGPLPPPPPVDVDGFTFTHVFPGSHTILGLEFSVSPASVGAAGTAVAAEAAAGDAPADIYSTALAGGNLLFADGDGLPPGPALPLGLIEPGSNVDGWDATPPFGPPASPGVHFTITGFDAAFHPVYAGTGSTGGDIFFSPPVIGYSVFPALYAGFGAIGLVAADDIDALAIVDDGSFGPSPADAIYFSLTPGSPTLAALGASPADILVTSIGGAPVVAFPAAVLGLLPTDDVDALDIFVVPEPASVVLLGLAVPWLIRRRA